LSEKVVMRQQVVRNRKNEPSDLRCPLWGLLPPGDLSGGNFLCPGQEERNLRETKMHIGNSRLVAESSLILDDVLKMEEKVCSTYSGILLLG
jgi:hypothetical protein